MATGRVFVTGTAGFIGYHLARLLLDEGFLVMGFDGVTDYYDVTLKQRRHQALAQSPGFQTVEAMLEADGAVADAVGAFQPDVIVHLAGQAGVRYSLENPRAYLDSNLTGTFNVIEAAKTAQVRHLLMASTSSVYGAGKEMPFHERLRTAEPLTFYAATKQANEVMAHAYAHLYGLPVTMFRFFTVYGPWGRPDMALFKFTRGILDGTPIDIYNHGEMWRDFTYVGDLVRAIRLLIDCVPTAPDARGANTPVIPGDTLSDQAPYRIVNIGNSQQVKLLDFVDAIEAATGLTAQRRYLEMQPGDVPATWADCQLLQHLTGYAPATDLADGVRAFVDWYREHYGV
ncbi:MAG: NAD-dependent epimerase/dehydratase family protein [Pseudomonadota bacterium]